MSETMLVCLHGSLRRQCEACDLADRLTAAEADIVRLKAELEQARLSCAHKFADDADFLDRLYSALEDRDTARAEVERLKAEHLRLQHFSNWQGALFREKEHNAETSKLWAEVQRQAAEIARLTAELADSNAQITGVEEQAQGYLSADGREFFTDGVGMWSLQELFKDKHDLEAERDTLKAALREIALYTAVIPEPTVDDKHVGEIADSALADPAEETR